MNFTKIIRFVFAMLTLIFGVSGCDTADSLDSPVDNFFLKYYGADGDQIATDILEDDQGNFWLLATSGERLSFEATSRVMLFHIDPRGRIMQQLELGESGDRAVDIERTLDNNYILLIDHRVDAADHDVKLVRVSNAGVKLDSSTYAYTGYQKPSSVTPLVDGGFIVTGTTEYDSIINLNPGNPDDLSDMFHFRCNNALQFDNTNWYEQSGSGTKDLGVKAIESNNEYLLFGSSNQLFPGKSESIIGVYYSRINQEGVTTGSGFLGDFDSDAELSFVSGIPLSIGGGGYLAVGTNRAESVETLQVIKVRSNPDFSTADEQWDREIPIQARKLTAVAAGVAMVGVQGYLVLANEADLEGRRNIWLTKIDLNGNVMWSTVFGSNEEDDLGARVVELQDGRILVLGTITLANGQSKVVLMKLNQNGRLDQ